MINRELLHCYNESIRIAKTRFTAWSDEATVVIAQDTTTPSPCTLTASAADQSIDLVITAPTTNTDGTSIVDLKDYTIYYSTSSGIDITNPATYSGTFNTTSTQHTFPTSAQHWFKAVANDKWSNSSTGSSEVNATPTVASGVPVSIDDYTDNISQVIVGDGLIGVEFQVPKTTWERFVGWKLYAEDDAGGGSLPGSPTWALIYTGSGPGFVYKNLNTTWLYEFKLVVLGEDGTVTSGTISDNSGAGFCPNSANNDNVVAVEIFAENITATNEIRGTHIKATAVITAGSGNNIGVLNGTDATYRIYAGHATPASAPFRVTQAGATTCSNLTITGGSININSGVFSVSAAGAVTCSNLSVTGGALNINSGVFSVSAAGALVASSATITGSLTAGSGSSINGTYLTNSSVTYGKIAANAVRTSELYIDGNINFKPGASSHSIYNITNLGFGTYIGANPQIFISAGSKLNLLSSGGLAITDSGGVALELISLSGGDISLESADDIILDVADAAAPMYIKDWVTAGGAQGSAAGRITLISNGITRYIRLYT